MSDILYSIKESTLRGIADAIRVKAGSTTVGTVTEHVFTIKTSSATSHDDIGQLSQRYTNTALIKFTNAQKIEVIVSYKSANTMMNLFYFTPGDYSNPMVSFPFNDEKTVQLKEDTIRKVIVFENTDSVTMYADILASSSMSNKDAGFYVQVIGYDANGNSIQESFTKEIELEKEIPVKYKPSDMASIINTIEGGSSDSGVELPEAAYTYSGSLQYLNYYGQYDWLFDAFGDKITIDATETSNWMYNSKLKDWKMNTTIRYTSMFRGMSELETVSGTITPGADNMLQNIFQGCRKLREVPEKVYPLFETNTFWSIIGVFDSCYSLRSIPQFIIDSLEYASNVNTAFLDCFVLDEITNFPIHTTYNSNGFVNSFKNTSRLKRFTFKTNNGTPYIAEWKSHLLDFSTSGWTSSTANIINYNSGITVDKQVYSDSSYRSLRDDPDWFASSSAYSRYNKISALETILSLPDTSAYLASVGGTNTIKFKGDAGIDTDGGAINTLTEEEIAVAAAKGWTVTLV